MNIISKKRKNIYVNPDAGNVEHNIDTFNKIATAVDTVSTNPISEPFGGDACASGCSEGLENKMNKDTIELEYKDLCFTQCGAQRDVDDWDEWDRCEDWIYEVDKDDLYTYIYESCIDEDDYPQWCVDEFDPNNDADWKKFETWLDDNFDEVFNKYQQKILDNYEDCAKEQAAEEYDPYDYVDWDSMPGGHDDDRFWIESLGHEETVNKQIENQETQLDAVDDTYTAEFFEDLDECTGIRKLKVLRGERNDENQVEYDDEF